MRRQAEHEASVRLGLDQLRRSLDELKAKTDRLSSQVGRHARALKAADRSVRGAGLPAGAIGVAVVVSIATTVAVAARLL